MPLSGGAGGPGERRDDRAAAGQQSGWMEERGGYTSSLSAQNGICPGTGIAGRGAGTSAVKRYVALIFFMR